MLMLLNIGTFSNNVTDEQATRDVQTNNHAKKDTVTVRKALLPKDALKSITSHVGKVRKWHESRTMPFTKGAGIILGRTLDAYEEYMEEERRVFFALRDSFLQAWDAAKAQAAKDLGDLYKEGDYDSKSEVARSFYFTWRVLPFPVSSGYEELAGTLSEGRIRELQARHQRDMEQSIRQAMADVWRRLMEPVQRMAERLSNPEAVFRDSLVENVREMVATIPALNLTADGALTQFVNEVQQHLTRLDSDALKASPVLRAAQAAKAAEIAARMADMGRRRFDLAA